MKKLAIYYVPGTGLSTMNLLIHLLCGHTFSDWLIWDLDPVLLILYVMIFPHSQVKGIDGYDGGDEDGDCLKLWKNLQAHFL